MLSSPFLALDGAVDLDSVGTASHYGNPFAEQRALVERNAIVDLSDRSVLEITGVDRLTWLHSLTSQSLNGLESGESAETLLLDASGRVEHVLRVVDDGASLWVLLDRDEGAGLLAWLDSMRFLLRVEIADRSDQFATVGSLGTPKLPIATPHGVPITWKDSWSGVATGGYQYALGEHPGGMWSWSESLVAREQLPALVARVRDGELPVAGRLAVDAIRIAAWRPWFSSEIDERSIPHETDWLRTAVHLNKGCYRGQETVAKVHNLGHPPRRLVLLHLDGSDNIRPERGASVLAEGETVGTITSFGEHYELGPIALAVLKRSTDPSVTLTVDATNGSLAASQQIIVPPDAGAVANVPRLPRVGATPRPGRS